MAIYNVIMTKHFAPAGSSSFLKNAGDRRPQEGPVPPPVERARIIARYLKYRGKIEFMEEPILFQGHPNVSPSGIQFAVPGLLQTSLGLF